MAQIDSMQTLHKNAEIAQNQEDASTRSNELTEEEEYTTLETKNSFNFSFFFSL